MLKSTDLNSMLNSNMFVSQNNSLVQLIVRVEVEVEIGVPAGPVG